MMKGKDMDTASVNMAMDLPMMVIGRMGLDMVEENALFQMRYVTKESG